MGMLRKNGRNLPAGKQDLSKVTNDLMEAS